MITQGATMETYKGIELFEALDGRYGTSGIGYWTRSGAFAGPFASVEWARKHVDRSLPKPAPKSEPMPAPTAICRKCGSDDVFGGAMFTTDRSSGLCDDCYG